MSYSIIMYFMFDTGPQTSGPQASDMFIHAGNKVSSESGGLKLSP